MRVLQVHNYYGSSSPSGENKVVDLERSLLKSNGCVVRLFARQSDTIRSMGARGSVIGAALTPWNPFAARDLRQTAQTFRPDVIHVHNTFPLISPAAFRAVDGLAARVLTLHNYRIVCPAAIPMREGRVCTECIDRRSVSPSLRYGCYRDSSIATAPLALNVWLHHRFGTWRDHVDAFVVFTEFQKQMITQAGVAEELIHVKPNFHPGDPSVVPFEQRPNSVVFVGRLTKEKGVRALVDAWRLLGDAAPKLTIVGDGDLRPELEKTARDLNIVFLGQTSLEDSIAQIKIARLLILPSEWFEGFPMVLQECFALGTPAAVSRIGPLPTIIAHDDTGGIFEPANPPSLAAEISRLWANQAKLAQMSAKARQAFEKKYTAKANFSRVSEIYRSAMDVARRRKDMR